MLAPLDCIQADKIVTVIASGASPGLEDDGVMQQDEKSQPPVFNWTETLQSCSDLPASGVSKALEEFVKLELLEGDNAYKCAECNKMVTAAKGFSIHRNPNVLTLLLKRFANNRGRKIKETQGEAQLYSLYAVIVHSGYSSRAGHYFCYIKSSEGDWHKINDASVFVSDITTVLNQQAYVLFYINLFLFLYVSLYVSLSLSVFLSTSLSLSPSLLLLLLPNNQPAHNDKPRP
ncbi:unnamed protein product [Pleuronectes platessa]|uniref:USP domain-containing protein n=1 Tax=Pleuronectes platessa TaxID=8262 RepID=A0A9N7UN61_PLEPL|nr:unnamed protein product [Pleuronectes platessa]